jgi:hypothetical protein
VLPADFLQEETADFFRVLRLRVRGTGRYIARIYASKQTLARDEVYKHGGTRSVLH